MTTLTIAKEKNKKKIKRWTTNYSSARKAQLDPNQTIARIHIEEVVQVSVGDGMRSKMEKKLQPHRKNRARLIVCRVRGVSIGSETFSMPKTTVPQSNVIAFVSLLPSIDVFDLM